MRLRRSRKVGGTSILLVDGLNMCYRMVHKLAALKHGEVGTGVIYGFLKNTHELVSKYGPEQVIVVWEGKDSRLRRKTMYSEYKAKRKSDLPIPKEDFYTQIDNLKELLYYLGMNNVDVPKFEADDVISVLCRNNKKDSIIVSTDGDFYQLVNSTIHIYNPIKDLLIQSSNFREVVGVDVADFLSYKSLRGDASDGIPGVRGIGSKKALEICNWLGYDLFLQAGYENIPPNLQKAFTPEARAQYELAYKLIDLFHVPLTLEEVLDKMIVGAYDGDEAKDLLMDYNMWSILDNWNDYETVFGKVELCP